jgi:hypothetical protein
MLVGMIRDRAFVCSENEYFAKMNAIRMAEMFGYKIANFDYEGPNKASVDDGGIFVWTEEVPLVE